MNAGNDYYIDTTDKESVYFFNFKNSQNETKCIEVRFATKIGADFACSVKCPVRSNLKSYIV